MTLLWADVRVITRNPRLALVENSNDYTMSAQGWISALAWLSLKKCSPSKQQSWNRSPGQVWDRVTGSRIQTRPDLETRRTKQSFKLFPCVWTVFARDGQDRRLYPLPQEHEK